MWSKCSNLKLILTLIMFNCLDMGSFGALCLLPVSILTTFNWRPYNGDSPERGYINLGIQKEVTSANDGQHTWYFIWNVRGMYSRRYNLIDGKAEEILFPAKIHDISFETSVAWKLDIHSSIVKQAEFITQILWSLYPYFLEKNHEWQLKLRQMICAFLYNDGQ